VDSFVKLELWLAVINYTSPSLHMSDPVFHNHSTDGYASVHIPGKIEISYGTRISSPGVV
ncbi:uncharacterized protein METZ01_LOCUS184989, partial [marine metagenome]